MEYEISQMLPLPVVQIHYVEGVKDFFLKW